MTLYKKNRLWLALFEMGIPKILLEPTQMYVIKSYVQVRLGNRAATPIRIQTRRPPVAVAVLLFHRTCSWWESVQANRSQSSFKTPVGICWRDVRELFSKLKKEVSNRGLQENWDVIKYMVVTRKLWLREWKSQMTISTYSLKILR